MIPKQQLKIQVENVMLKLAKTQEELALDMGYGKNYISEMLSPTGKVTSKFVNNFSLKYGYLLENPKSTVPEVNSLAADELIKARKKKGFTQGELANRLARKLNQSYSLRHYQKLEDGEFPKYKKEVVVALDSILGSQLSELIYEQKVPHETVEEKEGTDNYQVKYIRLLESELANKNRIINISLNELVQSNRISQAHLKALLQITASETATIQGKDPVKALQKASKAVADIFSVIEKQTDSAIGT